MNSHNPGRLILVPTPIGNLEDITMRALRVLREADMILAEDTRTSGKLLKHYDIDTRKQSYHIFNEHKVIASIVDRIRNGETMALVTDAGTPGISDPGFLLVRECLANSIDVECLPGPTAFVPALVASGLPTDRFVFEGFLPHKKGRATRLKEISLESRTIVLYESPHRLVKTLGQLCENLGDRSASVSRELTKIHEETRHGLLSELKDHYEKNNPKGEIVIVIAGAEK